MAQYRAGPTRKDSTEEPTLGPQLAVAERVYAAPEALQPPRCHPQLDRTGAETAFLQLVKGDHAVLPRRHRCGGEVGRAHHGGCRRF
jgi:hypothetical protein